MPKFYATRLVSLCLPLWVALYAIFGLVPLLRSSTDCATRNIRNSADYIGPDILASQIKSTNRKIAKSFSYDASVFELAVPFCGQSKALFEFSEHLGQSLCNLQSKVRLKLLITKCLDDNHLHDDEFVTFLEGLAGGIEIETVALNIKGSAFSRGLALNKLTERACNDPNCYFSAVDVDMDVKPSFIDNTIKFVNSTTTIYYPMVFSEFEPSAVMAAETIYGELEPYSTQRGLWRKHGWGMFAISGEAVHSLKVEKRLGTKWGGEDVELKKRAEERGYTIVRENEPGLIHRWHPKLCTSEFVQEEFLGRCRDARDKYSGSYFLQSIRLNDPEFYDYLVFLPVGPKRSAKAGSTWAANAYIKFMQEKENFQPDRKPRVGEMVSYFYNLEYGYQLATVVDEENNEEEERLKLEFLVDDEEMWIDYDARTDRKFNAKTTLSLEDCTESLHPSSSIDPSATVSCRKVHYKAPPHAAFEKAGKVIVGVLSSAANQERRNIIRQTWANSEAGIFFIVSGPWKDVEEEHNKYQDLIWIEGEEDVLLITYKTAMFFKVLDTMAKDLSLDYTHALKTDDDSYVAMEKLRRFLEERKDIDYYGQCRHYTRPFRDPEDKYYVSREEYAADYFPAYCQGGGFVLSRNFVECAAVEMAKTPFLSMEDVYMGMIAERCKVFPSQSSGEEVRIYRGEDLHDTEIRPATMKGKLIQHRVATAEDMKDHHAALLNDI